MCFLFIYMYQGSEYEEFVKAATSDNGIQFVETSSIDAADVLFPNIKTSNFFVGLVKSEPERYTAFSKYTFFLR